MTRSEPGSSEPGSTASAEVEAARRRLYAPGGASDDIEAEYRRLSDPPALSTRSTAIASDDGIEAAPVRPRRGWRRSAAVVPVGVLLAIVAAFGVGLLVRPGPPMRLPIPALEGETIAAYGRTRDPAVAAGGITYQPQGYSVFQPAGRVVHMAFRCLGLGTVRLAAGSVQSFRCTDREASFVRSGGRHLTAPFMVSAITTGDVVWSVRVTLRSD